MLKGAYRPPAVGRARQHGGMGLGGPDGLVFGQCVELADSEWFWQVSNIITVFGFE